MFTREFCALVRKPSDFPVVLFLPLCVSFGRFGQHPGCSITVSPPVCPCPCMFESCLFSGWTTRWRAVYPSKLRSLRLLLKGPWKETRLLAKPMMRAEWGATFFFWGTKAFGVDLLLGNVLPFETVWKANHLSLGLRCCGLFCIFWQFYSYCVLSQRWGCLSNLWSDGSVLPIPISLML